MLTVPIARQGFKPVRRWHAQIVQCYGGVEHRDLAYRHAKHIGRKSLAGLSRQKLFDQLALCALYHELIRIIW